MPYVLDTPLEYWLHEAVLHCYNPLAEMLEQRAKAHVVVHFSPALINQCVRPDYPAKFQAYCRARLQAVSFIEDPELKLIETDHVLRFGSAEGLIQRYRKLQDEGQIEILAGTATHPFLPMLSKRDARLQIEVGLALSLRFFKFGGGFWVPECALNAPLAELLSSYGIHYSYADPSCFPEKIPALNCKGVTFFIRDPETGGLIWDAGTGYPGAPVYRDFHTDFVGESPRAQAALAEHGLHRAGFSIRAVGNRNSAAKPFYKPLAARDQALEDALRFLKSLEGGENLVFDAELFGHWWHEGIFFLDCLFHEAEEGLFSLPRAVTPPAPIPERLILPSTWGTGCDASSWINEKTASLIEGMDLPSEAPPFELRARMLAQASDWLFLISHDTFASDAENMVSRLRCSAPKTKDLLWEELKTRACNHRVNRL